MPLLLPSGVVLLEYYSGWTEQLPETVLQKQKPAGLRAAGLLTAEQ